MNKIYLDEADLDYIPSTKGEDVRKFEKAMAEYLEVDDCVAVNSGTSALHLALLACGIGRGDTVIVPATTFVATANAVLYTGAKVKLIDIDSDTWQLPQKTYKRIKCIIPVSIYGDALRFTWPLNDEYSIVCDLAEGIFIKPQKQVFIDYFCYSFNGNKTLTTGAGGLIAGRNLEKIRKLIRPAYSDGLAYNYGMAAENARLGLNQLEKLPDYIKKKKEFNQIYREELSFLEFQGKELKPFWMTAALFPKWVEIERLKLRLEVRGVPTRRIFKPLCCYSQFGEYRYNEMGEKFPNAEYLYKHGLCLPSSVKNSAEDILEVCKIIKELI